MYKIAVVGDYDSIYGFAALGLDTYSVTDPESARATVRTLANSDCGVIYITEALADEISDVVDEFSDKQTPAIILIPGVFGNTGVGVASVKRYVEQAVGSDILFGGA